MTKKERMKKAMSGGIPDRVPFNPQICFPHAVRNLEKDYTKALIKGIEDPLYNLETLFEITKFYNSDGFRIMFIGEASMKVKLEGINYIAYDRKYFLHLNYIHPEEYDNPEFIENVQRVNPCEWWDKY